MSDHPDFIESLRRGRMYHIVGWVIRDESLAARHIVTLGSAPLQLDESEFWRGPRTGRFVDRIRASVVHKL